MTDIKSVGKCDWCDQVRPLVQAPATVHLPQLDATFKEQPALEVREMNLCFGCAHFHQSQAMMGAEGPTYAVQRDPLAFYDAARRRFFLTWGLEAERIPDDDLTLLVKHYFAGLNVTMSPRGYNVQGLVVTLHGLPKIRHLWVGQDPSLVEPCEQDICVQFSPFIADSMGRRAACALAAGLNVYVREMAITRRRYLGPLLEQLRAQRSPGKDDQEGKS